MMSTVSDWLTTQRSIPGTLLRTGTVAAVALCALPHTPTPHTTPGIGWKGHNWGNSRGDLAATRTDGTYAAGQDAGSLATITEAIGARTVWGQRDAAGRAITGRGVTVALLDTGVAAVPGLDGAGKVAQGPDLSLDTNAPPLRGGDHFGHGTHLASIITARDAVAADASGRPLPTSADNQLGVAPDATLLSMKVAASDGSTDVSQVVAALDWIVAHRNDNGMSVRVVNLSYGTTSKQAYGLDPLATAAENAWHHGLVVVVSGGNDGAVAGGLTDPAIDPYVIAVGASDASDSVTGWRRPTVATFSSRGTAARHVDLLAPGSSLVGLRDPGAWIDVHNPEGRVSGDITGRLFRGSGTSQAAAVVSGAAALLLQKEPTLTPDEVKAALVGSARPVKGAGVLDQGAGELDVAAAARVAKHVVASAARAASASQTFPVATGLGSLEAARGDSHLIDPITGAGLVGEHDVQGQAWSPLVWGPASAAGTSWTGGSWNNATWSGTGWVGAQWTSSAWDGVRWTGVRWTGVRWTAQAWTGVSWTGVRWTSNDWN